MGLHRKTFYNHRVRVIMRTGEIIFGRMGESRRGGMEIRLEDGKVRTVRYKDVRTMGPINAAGETERRL